MFCDDNKWIKKIMPCGTSDRNKKNSRVINNKWCRGWNKWCCKFYNLPVLYVGAVCSSSANIFVLRRKRASFSGSAFSDKLVVVCHSPVQKMEEIERQYLGLEEETTASAHDNCDQQNKGLNHRQLPETMENSNIRLSNASMTMGVRRSRGGHQSWPLTVLLLLLLQITHKVMMGFVYNFFLSTINIVQNLFISKRNKLDRNNNNNERLVS